VCADSLWSYRAHKAPRRPCVCIIMCCGAVFAQNKPCTRTFGIQRAHNIHSKCRMERHTMRERTRPLRLFISQYYCFRPSTTRHQVPVKFAFCGAHSILDAENNAIHCDFAGKDDLDGRCKCSEFRLFGYIFFNQAPRHLYVARKACVMSITQLR
jgi:hypothetical protein